MRKLQALVAGGEAERALALYDEVRDYKRLFSVFLCIPSVLCRNIMSSEGGRKVRENRYGRYRQTEGG
jgi:hypothetical protein